MDDRVAGGRVHRADVQLAVALEQGGQRQMVVAIHAFLLNPDEGLAVPGVDLPQEVALLVADAFPPGVDLGNFHCGSGIVGARLRTR